MGSWSVYCGISKIAITQGQKCVLLPIKKNERGYTYMPYLPATLPVFGEYDDYGGIENIEVDENTKAIEKYFDCKIDDFCQFFTRGCIRDDEDDFPKYLKERKELEEMDFMFIDRQVYDFMSSHVSNGEYGAGRLEYGNPKILELIGFKYNGENTNSKIYDSKRYNQEYEFDGIKFHSDGTYLHYNNEGIYCFDKGFSKLSEYITIPEDKKWIGTKAMHQMWKCLDPEKAVEKLSYIIGVDASNLNMNKHLKDMLEMLKDNPEALERIKDRMDDLKSQTIAHYYLDNLDEFGDRLAELVTIRHNLHPMSGTFEPHTLYLTPQCGEHRLHQIILDKFAEINKSYVEEDYDEDDE